MTKEEMVKKVKSKMCKDCGIYLGGGKCSDSCSVIEIIKVLEQADILKQYKRAFKVACELLNGDHLFGYDKDTIFDEMMKKDGVVCGSSYEEFILNNLDRLGGKEQEPKYCDRNICVSNEYNGIGCDECEITKSQESRESEDDLS